MNRTARRTPFTVVDETLHRCDRPEEPQTAQLEIRVAGSLDEARLREAVREAVACHPMARVSKAADRQLLRPPVWEVHDPGELDLGRVVSATHATRDSTVGELRDAFYSHRVDVTQPPPFRLTLVARPGGDTILFTVNHAAFDGIGAFRLLRSVASAYCGQEVSVPVDEIALRHPAVPEAPGGTSWPPPRRDGNGRPSLIAARAAVPGPGYGFHQRVVPGLALRSPYPANPGPGVTVNDVLMAALHQSIAEWNRARGEPCGRLQVLMPVNLRPETLRSEVVGNVVGTYVVTTDADDRRDAPRLLAAVGAQTQAAKAGAAAAMYRRPAWVQKALPVLLPLLSLPVLRWRWQTAAVLSNLGNLDGMLEFASTGSDPCPMTECWAAAPNYMPMGLSVGAASVGDRLCLAFRYRRALFDAGSAATFAGLFERELVRLLEVREGMRKAATR